MRIASLSAQAVPADAGRHAGLTVQPIPARIAGDLIRQHHYTGTMPGGTKLSLGVFGGTRLLGVITLGVGPTNAFGNIDPTNLDLAYIRSLVNRTLVTQFVTLDPGQTGIPVALSDARIGTMPGPPRPSPRAAYLYAATPTTPNATLWTSRAVIAHFEF